MRINTKGKLAVTAMIDLALRAEGGAVSLAAISMRQKISLSYLEQLFGKLRRNGLVESIRGPGGGYALTRAAESITVAEIIKAVDDVAESDQPSMPESTRNSDGRCDTSSLWHALGMKMDEFLVSISLRMLVDEQLENGILIGDVTLRRGISSEPVVKPIKISGPNSVFALANAFLKSSDASPT